MRNPKFITLLTKAVTIRRTIILLMLIVFSFVVGHYFFEVEKGGVLVEAVGHSNHKMSDVSI